MASDAADRPGLTIVLLDHNRVFADVLALRLREEPEVRAAHVVGTVAEAVELVAQSPPDLLLVAQRTAGEATLTAEVMDELADLDVRPDVLVLSGTSDHRAVLAAFECGVRGWVTTDYSFASLLTSLREVASGHMVISPAAVEPIVLRLLSAIRADDHGERPDFVATLSPREYEVLRCLVAGLTKKEIAHRLFLSVNTVRTHVQHLLRAADQHTTLALVAAARELDVTGIDDGR